MTEEQLINQFNAMDTDASGQIDVAEVLKQMPAALLSSAQELLQMMDIDVNGQINLDEYIRFYHQPDSSSLSTTSESELEAINEEHFDPDATLDELLDFDTIHDS